MPSNETMQHFNWIENIAYRCIASEQYFNLITGYENEFCSITQNMFGEQICVLWSHIFGNENDDFHYTKFFKREDITLLGDDYNTDSIKNRMLYTLNMNDNEYDVFWNEIKSCRDKFVAHKEILTQPVVFPKIDKCILMIKELRLILEELANKWLQIEPNNNELTRWVEYYNHNSNHILVTRLTSEFKKEVILLSNNVDK